MELVGAIQVVVQRSDARHFGNAFLEQGIFQFFDCFGKFTASIQKVGVVSLHVRLHQQTVIHCQLGVEANGTDRGYKNTFILLIMSRLIVCNESSQLGYNDTIILQQQYFDMSS